MSDPIPRAHPLQPMYQPSAYIPPPPRQSFAHSSSAKRGRSVSPAPSSSGSEDGNDDSASLDDPLDLDSLIANEGGDITQGRKAGNDELEETNRGMKMLLKMGWSAGQGLGKDGQGRTAPIDPGNNTAGLGIGKLAHDSKMLDSTTLTTRRLASEQQAAETADQAAARRHKAAFEAKVKADVLSSLANFRCDTCGGKQYSNARLYNEHLNSYDHHHQARAVALKKDALERARASGETDKRREKEKKREEKALAKLMGAAGVKAPTPISTATPTPTSVSGVKPVGAVKKGGWARVGGGGGFSSAGFASVGGAPAVPATEAAGAVASASPVTGGGGGFKKGGWSSFTSMATAKVTDSGPATAGSPLEKPASAEQASVLQAAPAFVSGGSFSLSVEDGLASRPPSPAPPAFRQPPPRFVLNAFAAQPPALPPSALPPPPPPAALPPPPPPPAAATAPPPPPPLSHAGGWHSQPPPPPRPTQDGSYRTGYRASEQDQGRAGGWSRGEPRDGGRGGWR